MPSGIGHLCGFDDDFNFIGEEETGELFPALGVIVPTMPQNWIQWVVGILSICLHCNGSRVR